MRCQDTEIATYSRWAMRCQDTRIAAAAEDAVVAKGLREFVGRLCVSWKHYSIEVKFLRCLERDTIVVVRFCYDETIHLWKANLYDTLIDTLIL